MSFPSSYISSGARSRRAPRAFGTTATLNQAVSGLRFFFGITLGRTDLPVRIPYARKAKTLPVVLAADTVGRLLEAVDDLTCRVALATAYATGLRTSEVVGVRIEHIETERKLIRVACGKGAKDRYVPLSPGLHTLLRAYWKVVRTRPHLFMNDARCGPLTTAALNAAIKDAAAKIGVAGAITVKTRLALLCDASARTRYRHSRHPDAARRAPIGKAARHHLTTRNAVGRAVFPMGPGPRPTDHDGALHQGLQHADRSDAEPT